MRKIFLLSLLLLCINISFASSEQDLISQGDHFYQIGNFAQASQFYQQVVSGGTVGTLPANPTRSGYTFGGWYTAVSGGGTAFTASTTVTASLTVYAKWTAVIGSSTATATYTWTSGTSTLVITWTGSNFICNGPPSSGAERKQV